jgi:type IV pilus assembly protein PilM
MGTSDRVAIDVGSHSLKACTLAGEGEAHRLTALAVEPAVGCIDAGQITDRARLAEAMRRLVTGPGLGLKQVSLTASFDKSVVRAINVPLMTDAELVEQIPWELEQYVPYDIKDLSYGFQVVRRRPEAGQMDLLLAATPKSVLEPLVETARAAGLEPIAFAPPVLCAASWFVLRNPRGAHALLDVGASSASLIAVIDGVAGAARSVARGGEWLTREIARRLGVSRDEAERLKLAHCGSPGSSPESRTPHKTPDAPYRGGESHQVTLALAVAQQFGEELADLVRPALDHIEAASSHGLGSIWVVGGAGATAFLCEAITARTQRPAMPWDPTSGLSVDEPAREIVRSTSPGSFAAVLGLAAARGPSIPLAVEKGFFARLFD